MTNKEFLEEVQKSCHLDMQQCLMLEGSLQKMLAKAAVDQLPVVLTGLGVFTSHKHPEYIQEDAQTGAMTLFPPRISYRMQTEDVEGALSGDKLLSDYAKVREDEATAFIGAIVQVVNDHLQKGEEVEIQGLGTFKNVLTHHSDLQHVAFSPCETMKQQVNAPFECFEPLVISEGIAKIQKVVVNSTVAETETETEPIVVEPESVEPETVIVEPEPREEEPEPQQEEPEPVESVSEPVIEEKEVPAAELPTPDKDLVVIGDEKKSETRLIYISLSIIMVACVLLLWLMFGHGVANLGNEVKESVSIFKNDPEEAVVIEKDDKKEEIAPANIVDTLVQDSVVVEEKKPDTIAVVESKPVPEPAKPVEVKKPVESAPKDYHRMIGADCKPVTVKLQNGERLTLLALKYFGDKSFWPYIFDANADKLKAPNMVQAGMTLYLPDPIFYGIDVQNEASIRKAKNRAAQLLK